MSKTKIGISKVNPHYFTINGKLKLLISSAEHYGALVNRAFDFSRYFHALAGNGFNQTRLFSGNYFEKAGDFNFRSNPLAPEERHLMPLFAENGSRQLHSDYVKRLRAILAAADEAGVVVEFVLFCAFYNDWNYEHSPMALPGERRQDFFTYLSEEQKDFTRQVLEVLKPFDNVIIELANEPYWAVADGAAARLWNQELAEFVKAAAPEKLMAWNVGNNLAMAYNDVPDAEVLNFHYMHPECVPMNWYRNVPIVDDETGFCGSGDRPYREEAYLAILSGAAGYSNLDMTYTVETPEGAASTPAGCTHGGGFGLHRQLRVLADFMGRFDLSCARPDTEVFRHCREDDGTGRRCRRAVLQLGEGHFLGYAAGPVEEMAPVLSEGKFRLNFFDPLTGEKVKEDTLTSDARWMHRIEVPAGSTELLLEIVKKQ